MPFVPTATEADRGEIDRKSQRMYKANLRFAIEKYSQFEIDLLFELFKAEPGRALAFPRYLSLLIKRLLDAGFVGFENSGGLFFMGGMKLNPDYVVITDKGRRFVESVGLEDIGY